MTETKIAYIYDAKLEDEINRIPTITNRGSVVHDLICCYKLLTSLKVTVFKSKPATEDELKEFHSSAYVEFLKKVNEADDLSIFTEEEDEFGLGYDCPLLDKCFDFVSTIAGSSLSAAKLLTDHNYHTVINWFGGWHHAQRHEAEGFCYVNDIVLAIQKLTTKFNRVLYVDLDVHHGNGVENAFSTTNKVLTLSFHKYSPGFYPGTGNFTDVGLFKNQLYVINVPFKDGISDTTYLKVFNDVFPRVTEAYKPLAVVIQCGADILKDDPLGCCNVTINAMGKCIQTILDTKLPSIFLGGGGYNLSNTARYWTYLTSLILKEAISNDIPDDSEYFMLYGPSFELEIEAGNMKDNNTPEYQKELLDNIFLHCDKLKQIST